MRHRLVESGDFDEALADKARARRSLRERHRLQNSLVTFVAVGNLLVFVWAVSGARYFWPGWILGAFALTLGLSSTRSRRGPERRTESETQLVRIGKRGR